MTLSPPSTGADSSRTLRLWTGVAFVLAALPGVVALGLERWQFGDLDGFPLDDAWIHLQFARNLAGGFGLSFNPGEPVAGTTSPLWTALLALLSLLPGPATAWAKIAGLAAHLAGLVFTFRVATRFGLSPRRAAFAVLLVGWSDGLVLGATSGMEVPLFLALLLAGVERQIAERAAPRQPPVAFLLFGLAALTRPEGALLPLLAVIDRLLPRRELRGSIDGLGPRLGTALRGLALAALLIAPVALVFYFFSGSFVPTTLGAKSAGPAPLVPNLRNLAQVVGLLFASQPLPVLLAAGGAVELARRLGGRRDVGLLLPLWTFLQPVASTMLTGGPEFPMGNFGRYFHPLLPCVVLLGMVALEPLSAARGWMATSRSRWVARATAVVAGAVLMAVPVVRTLRIVPFALQARANVEASSGEAARWLAAHVAPEARLALSDIGLVRYRLPNPIVDLAGIANPERQRFLAAQRVERGIAWPQALRLWLELERPDYVVTHPAWFPLLEREPERFPALARFRIANNIAMAGDELVIYSTPWTREAARP